MCSSSRGQNCITQHLVSSHSVGGRPVHRMSEESSLNLCTRQIWWYQMLYNTVLTSW